MKPDKTGIDLNNVKMSMNPFCEALLMISVAQCLHVTFGLKGALFCCTWQIAVEEGLRLKEPNPQWGSGRGVPSV